MTDVDPAGSHEESTPEFMALDVPQRQQSADMILKSRRERGRRAQQAYRERQLENTRRLEKQSETLRTALADLLSVLQNPVEPVAAVAVQRARSLVGLEEHRKVDTYDASQVPGDNNDYLGTADLPNISSSEDYIAYSVEGWKDPNSLINSTGRYSPRLTYGLWIEPERPIQINDPFPDIVSFLREGYTTFAGTLFWRSMALSFAVGSAFLQQYRSGIQQQTVQENNILQLPFHVDNPDLVLKRVEARLSFHKYGTLEVGHPGRDQEGAIRLSHKILALLEEKGVQTKDFLDVREVVQFLRHRFGVFGFAQLETSLTRPKEGPRAVLANRLVDELAPRAICLGDGPRFRIGTLIEVVNKVSSDVGQQIFVGLHQSETARSAAYNA